MSWKSQSWETSVRSALLSAAATTTLLSLSACGSSADETTAKFDPIEAAIESTSTDESIALSQVPIELDAALGRLPIEIIETAPCPFLSDETALSGVTTKFDFTRRKVANSECVWNYNIGFEINVRITPVEDATPRADRVYNLENPPVLVAQTGPGNDATVFTDPTWDAENPRPYAFGFTQNNQDIMISTVGVRTTPEQLHSVAVEIAERLPTAPQIEPQIRQAAEIYDPCEIWTTAEVATLFGIAQTDPGQSSPFGQTACTFGFYPSNGSPLKVRAGIFECNDDHLDVRQGHDFELFSDLDAPAVKSVSKKDWGTDFYIEAKAPEFCVAVSSTENRDPIPDALEPGLNQLTNNLLARVVAE